MKKILAFLLVICISTSAWAQAPSKTDNIRKMIRMTGGANIAMQMIDNMITTFKANFKDVPEELWQEFKSEIKPEDFENMVVPIYDKYYTNEDVLSLIAFYDSPAGKKMIAVLPAIMQESMAAGQAWGKQIAEKVVSKMQAKGYGK